MTTPETTALTRTLGEAAALLPEPWPRRELLTVQHLVDVGFDRDGVERFVAGFAQGTGVESAISLFKQSADDTWADLTAADALGWFLYTGESDGLLPTTPFMIARPGSWLPWAAGLDEDEITAGNLPDEETLRTMAALRGYADTARYRP